MIYTTTPELLKKIKVKMLIDDISNKKLSQIFHKSESATSALLSQPNISLDTLKELCDALEYTLEVNITDKDGNKVA